MQSSIITDVLLPIALALIMFGMGLGLVKQDFTRLLKTPVIIGVGLFGQLIVLPILAFSICLLFDLSTSLAIGLMIIAACPGGTMSNVISQLARANIALSVSLTSISTLICVFTTPFIIHASIDYFSTDKSITFSLLNTSLSLIALTLIPVILGISVRHRWPENAQRAEVYFRRFSLFFMLTMIIALVIKERHLLISSFNDVFFASLTLNIASVALGVIFGVLCRFSQQDAMTLGIEVGIQNATLAILIAVSFLNQPAYAITAGVYGLAMYLGPIPLILWAKRQQNATKNTLAASP